MPHVKWKPMAGWLSRIGNSHHHVQLRKRLANENRHRSCSIGYFGNGRPPNRACGTGKQCGMLARFHPLRKKQNSSSISAIAKPPDFHNRMFDGAKKVWPYLPPLWDAPRMAFYFYEGNLNAYLAYTMTCGGHTMKKSFIFPRRVKHHFAKPQEKEGLFSPDEEQRFLIGVNTCDSLHLPRLRYHTHRKFVLAVRNASH